MPSIAELEGRAYPPTASYLVGREKVREFARAVQATHPEYFDVGAAQAAGHDDLVAPPTFPIVVQHQALDALLADPETGIELHRIVHGEQRFTHTRPIVAGDELTAQLTIAKVRALGANSLVTCETAISDAAGSHVVTTTSVLLIGGDS